MNVSNATKLDILLENVLKVIIEEMEDLEQ